MLYPEWEPFYLDILEDMGYSMASDESSARLLKAVMARSDLIGDDELRMRIPKKVIITGGSPFDVLSVPEDAAIIATGSSIPAFLSAGRVPEIIVTDLDGDVESQKKASRMGSVTVMHAHGDNADAIMHHAADFKGKVLLTTQSRPDNVICNFGGFTDGDRAVCMARHLGAEEISLKGFDLDNPSAKDGIDIEAKRKKLGWAKKIIAHESNGIFIVSE